MCGGTDVGFRHVNILLGLSPRVRGNRRAAPARGRSRRSIPACAGEPRHVNTCSHLLEVYPRVCGGTPGDVVVIDEAAGLSPRVRGNPPVRLSARLSGRSIPACAGEPRIGYTADEAWEVYPRVCGGTSPALDAGTGRRGLSPRVRGNQAQAEIESRVRGLSPRVRGNRPGVPQRGGWPGSIPACAGEPLKVPNHLDLQQVYPRVCGGTGTPSRHSPS